MMSKDSKDKGVEVEKYETRDLWTPNSSGRV